MDIGRRERGSDSPICRLPGGVCSYPAEPEALPPLDRLALAIFCELQDQWEVRVHMSGATIRLPSSSVRNAVESHGLEWKGCAPLLERIRILTRFLTTQFSERQKVNPSTDDGEVN